MQKSSNGYEYGWAPILTFIVAEYGATWGAFFAFRHDVASGDARGFWAFLLITVWSPTVMAVVIAGFFKGRGGIRRLLGMLFRKTAQDKAWYLIAFVAPVALVWIAIGVAKMLYSGAPFLALSALPITAALQLGTGALGEELGWRGFLLSELQSKFSERKSAVAMTIVWALWHLPAFFLPGMPQALVPPLAFLIAVAGFGVFLALVFNRTGGHVMGTTIAHFGLNLMLAIGGARLGATLWWCLALLFCIVAIWSAFQLAPSRDSHSTGW